MYGNLSGVKNIHNDKGVNFLRRQTILNVYVPKNSVKWDKTGLQGKIDEITNIIGNFNIHLSEMGRSSRQNISEDIVELTLLINRYIDIHRPLYPTIVSIHFSQVYMEHSPRYTTFQAIKLTLTNLK